MGKITKNTPTDEEVRGIFADTYNLFTKYKDVPLLEYENEINLACETIEGNYDSCQLSASMVEAVLRVLIDRSGAK